MSVALSLSQLVLALVFTVAGAAKLLDRAGTRRTLSEFGVRAGMVGAAAVALPLVELAVAVALLPAATAFWGSFAALGVLGIFSAAIGRMLVRGSAPDCNCFGGLTRTAVGRGTLLRNGVLGALAAFAAIGSAHRSTGAAGWVADVAARNRAAVVAIAVLVVAVLALSWFCRQVLRRNGRLLLRLDAQAEELGAGGAGLDSPGFGLPLKPGDTAPAFTSDDLDGEPLSLESLLADGPPVALLFTDPLCSGCQAPLEAAARAQRERADELTVAVVSRGDPGRLRERAEELALTRVIHDPDDSLFNAFGFAGSPAAQLIDTDGRVASAPVMGTDRVVELLSTAPAVLAVRVKR